MSDEIDKLLASVEIVLCSNCQEQNIKSIVTHGGTTSTLAYYVPFWDEDGREHQHDGNSVITNFSCSNGHSFSKQRLNSCWCGWKQGAK